MRYLLLCVTLLVTFANCKAQSRASYGESCNRTTRCDSRALLFCSNETCECLKEAEMTFDTVRGKCVVIAGERCMYTAMESEGEDRQERRWAEALECIENAKCNTDGYCGCQDEFHENSEGHCAANKGFGENCEKHDECRKTDNLVCEIGKCSCNSTEAVYDEKEGKCVGKPGASCYKYSTCVKNAHRSRCGYGGVHNFCQCQDDFRANSDGECVSGKVHGELCERSEDCKTSAYLICQGGNCSCNETEAVYDADVGMCVSQAKKICQKYSRCVLNTENYGHACLQQGHAKCYCRGDYVTSDKGLCLGSHGTPCHPVNSPCQDDLSCYGGQCSCPFPNRQEYDSNLRKCRSFVHAPCSETLRGNLLQFECVDNAECRDDHGVNECLCKSGFVKSGDYHCKKVHGTACAQHDECDVVPDAQLKCMEGICSCDDLQVYDEQSGKCLGLVGAFCLDYKSCIQNARCERERSDPTSKFGICRCNSNSEDTIISNRKCKQITIYRGR